MEAAFQTLKESSTAPVLAYPQPRERFVIDTDASNVRIGGMLSQVEDGQERVTAHFNKTLNEHERYYCVTERIARALEHIHKNLYGQELHLRTDKSAATGS